MQEDYKLEASMDHIARPYIKTPKLGRYLRDRILAQQVQGHVFDPRVLLEAHKNIKKTKQNQKKGYLYR